jgi:hypothetical protein
MSRWFVALLLICGCRLHSPLSQEEIHGLGSFEFREAEAGMAGVVVGAPHERSEQNADKIARAISDRTGAGLVIAYGFKSKRLEVTQPVLRSRPYLVVPADPLKRGSVFREYKKILRDSARGNVDLYIGIHRSRDRRSSDPIEVATSGLTFEEAAALKDAYIQIRDEQVREKKISKIKLAIEPLDPISWRVSGVKHHGVLMTAAKGLNIRIPEAVSSDPVENIYREILCRWMEKVIKMVRDDPGGVPEIQVRLEKLGRLELIRPRKDLWNAVIGSPHGTFDEFTAEIVKRISYRTDIAAVIARGFTPTQAGGWRINVNRPTEKTFPSEGLELHTNRAREVYESFKELVLMASGGHLNLYIDIHQYNTDAKIQVATVGVTAEQARIIKMIYKRIRNSALEHDRKVEPVDLLIEPLDQVPIGAWAAKSEGILSVAQMGLHFELPAHRILDAADARETYTQILANLFRQVVPFLLHSPRWQQPSHLVP